MVIRTPVAECVAGSGVQEAALTCLCLSRMFPKNLKVSGKP